MGYKKTIIHIFFLSLTITIASGTTAAQTLDQRDDSLIAR